MKTTGSVVCDARAITKTYGPHESPGRRARISLLFAAGAVAVSYLPLVGQGDHLRSHRVMGCLVDCAANRMGIRQNIRLVVRRHEILYVWHILLINGYEWIAHKHFKYRARLKVCPKFCDIAPRGQAQTTFWLISVL